MHERIKSPLQECRINRAERLQAARCQAGCEKHCVLLSYANVEILVRMMHPESVQSGAIRHGGGNRNHLVIPVGEFDQRVSENLGICPLPHWLSLTGLRIIRPQAVEFFLFLERRLKAISLLREDV